MKFVKFLPTVLAALVLSACSSSDSQTTAEQQSQAKMEQTIQATEQRAKEVAEKIQGEVTVDVTKATNGTKSVVYRCLNNKRVSATYAFQDDEVKAVNLVVGRGKNAKQIPTLLRDMNNPDFTAFKSEQYMWNVENGFNLQNATTKAGGNLTQIGTSSDTILAKLCNVDKVATSRLKK